MATWYEADRVYYEPEEDRLHVWSMAAWALKSTQNCICLGEL